MPDAFICTLFTALDSAGRAAIDGVDVDSDFYVSHTGSMSDVRRLDLTDETTLMFRNQQIAVAAGEAHGVKDIYGDTHSVLFFVEKFLALDDLLRLQETAHAA